MLDWRDFIEERADVLGGKPVFKGTRVGVQMVLERLANGAGEADVLDAFPRLTAQHLRAAMAYAAAVIGMDETLFAEKS